MHPYVPMFVAALALSAPVLATETVPVPAFRNLELRGGGDVVLLPGPAQRVTIVEGSSAFTRIRVDPHGKLWIDACNARCPQHYRLRVEVQSPRVPGLGVSGGGSIRAAGGFAVQDQIAVGVNGGGKVDVRGVEGRDVAVGLNGGGQVLVRARSTLAVGVNGGGEVRYLGHPKVTSAIDGGGTVRPIS